MSVKKHTGITVRAGRRGTTYRAECWDVGANKSVSKTFPTLAAAKSWRAAMQTKIRSGEAGAVQATTFAAAAEEWMTKATAGVIKTRDGSDYKPSTLRGYQASLDLYALPALGNRKLTDIRLDVVQDYVEALAAQGLSRSSIRSHTIPLRVVFNDAQLRRLVFSNPVRGIKPVGAAEVPRDRIAAAPEAVRLLAALKRDRALWATAFYTGLRCGELMALDWSCVDLVEQTIRVERNYDPKAKQFVAAKTKAGARTVPFPDLLLPYLAGEDRTEGLVFGKDGVTPFCNNSVRKRALKAWALAGEEPITPHEARHTYASLMLAAGIDMTKVSKWLGHASIVMTVDRYGHLVPGSAREDMRLFQEYLESQPPASERKAAP